MNQSMKTELFKLQIGQEVLEVFTIRGDENSPRFFFLHGGGTTSCKELMHYIARPFLEKNIGMVSFDFSGHGQSSGELKKGSLQKRTLEATQIIKHFSSQKPLIVCALSMSGHVAAKIIEQFSVDTLILFCPALYSSKAFDVQFDQGFTQIIREFESWRDTDVFHALESFAGKLLVVMGDKDAVIPPGVIEFFMKHTPKASKKEIYTIENCPHKIFEWIDNKPEELRKLHGKIAEYII